MTNQEIAAILEGTAKLLDLQQADPFRARSYREAADSLRRLELPIAALYEERGESGFQQLKGIGPRLAASLREIIETGELGFRDRLENELSSENLLSQVSGIGKALAERIHVELGIVSLRELAQAAKDGRLARIRGIGIRRLKGVRDSLAAILGPFSASRPR